MTEPWSVLESSSFVRTMEKEFSTLLTGGVYVGNDDLDVSTDGQKVSLGSVSGEMIV